MEKTAVVMYCKDCGGMFFCAVHNEHIADDVVDIGRYLIQGHRIAEMPVEEASRQVWCNCQHEGQPTQRAADGSNVCRVVEHLFVDGVCAECGSLEPPRR